MSQRYFNSEVFEDTTRTEILVSSESAWKPKRVLSKSRGICVYCTEQMDAFGSHICNELRCSECFERGHLRGMCPFVHSTKSSMNCTFCGNQAHSKDNCPHAGYIASCRITNGLLLNCFVCGKQGHLNCSKFPGPRVIYCPACGETGHSLKQCESFDALDRKKEVVELSLKKPKKRKRVKL